MEHKSNEENFKYSYHYLNDDITNKSIRPAVEWILTNNRDKNPYSELYLFITSPGGETSQGFALIDTIRGSSIPVITVGLGKISSMGLMLFMAGKKRILTPNTMILSHQFWGYREGKEHELIAGQKKHDIVAAQIMNHYKKCTGLSEKKIRKYLLPQHDVWLTAQEALDLNICDEVREI